MQENKIEKGEKRRGKRTRNNKVGIRTPLDLFPAHPPLRRHVDLAPRVPPEPSVADEPLEELAIERVDQVMHVGRRADEDVFPVRRERERGDDGDLGRRRLVR